MKKLTEFLDLPLVQRFLDNRLAIGAACALMVAAGVVAAMLTTGGTEPVSDAKSAVRETAAETARPEEQAGKESGQDGAAETRSRPEDSATRGEPHPPRRSSGDGHRLATSFGNGTFFVGGAIAPGTYTTQGSDGEPGGCRWARLAHHGGELVAILSGSTWGPTHLTVHDGEFVRSRGCQTWSRSHSGGPHRGK
ncbi:hypothetical protein [Streptomyces sp. B5E4]|uniref:hypothetical protein n=1 Tax=Streptomyces sp. B5E4 TaxID=3153568 RepID=UPI00325DEA1B